VKTLHIVDEAVTTAKLPDLAVTFPDKIDDPTWIEVQTTKVNSTFTLTTTRTTALTMTVTVPAWVDQVTVFGIGESQLTNTSGATSTMSTVLVVDGADSNGFTTAVENNQTHRQTGAVAHSIIGVAGSTFDVDLDAFVSAGSHSSHNHELRLMAVGSR